MEEAVGAERGREVWLTTHECGRDRGWYDVVAQVSGYLVVYFSLPSDVTRGSRRGYSVGTDLCRKGDGSVQIELKLYDFALPEEY